MNGLPVKSKCRSCGRPVYFVKDENNKIQILDAVAPVYEIVDEGFRCRRIRAINAFVSHFATCKDANKWSKNKG